jgi:hypothetical protein
MSGIRVGAYVTHSQRPAWGVGKVFGQSQQHILVGFSNVPESERFKRMEWRPGLLERADVKNDVELDSWKVDCDSTCHPLLATVKVRKTAKAALWTKEQGMEKFLNKFNGGFPDAWYRSSHRDARLAQTKLWNELFPEGRLRELAVDQPHIAAQHILKILDLREKPLLHVKNEQPRLRAAFMRTEKTTAPLFDAYIAAFNALEMPAKKTPLTWPIVTCLLFIAQPTKHMFVKPTPMRNAAAGLGFELRFKASPNYATYDRVIAFSNELLEFIEPRSGQDMIDVQAFIGAVVE